MILGFVLRLALLWAIVASVVYFFVKADPGKSFVIGAGVLCSIILVIYWFGLWF